MTHPLTPREKVAGIVSGAEVRVEYDSVGRQYAFVRDAVGTADAILTALASGSGDHAELARLADLLDLYAAAREDEFTVEDVQLIDRGSGLISTLLAEIAALRAQSDFYKRDNDVLMKNTWVSRATEAERKLAEAVGLLRRIDRSYADMQDGNGNHPTELRKVRSFLSKEAERGSQE